MEKLIFWGTGTDNITPKSSSLLPTWLLIILAVLIFVGITALSYFIMLHFDKKKHPENYIQDTNENQKNNN